MTVALEQKADTKNSLLVRAIRGQVTERCPVWFMRQAGRFLPEYRELRKKHKMLELIRTPDLAAEVTLQPLRRFDLDGSILFADILNPLIGMGIELEFVEGIGPVIANPINSKEDVLKLRVPDVEENVGYSLEAIKIICRELESRNIPLLGFCGAPFTLSAYMIEGKSSKSFLKLKSFMYKEKESWDSLQSKLVNMLTEYLLAQLDAGVSAVQIFDSWLGQLSPSDYTVYVKPYLNQLIKNLRLKTDVPIIFFATGTAGLYPQLGSLDVDVFGVDWRVSLTEAKKLLSTDLPLQGNLDPVLLAEAPLSVLTSEVKRILKEGQELSAHIFNLGHGIIPSTPIDNVRHVVDIVRKEGFR